MDNEKGSICLIGMNKDISDLLRKLLEGGDYNILTISAEKAALSDEDAGSVDCVIIDSGVLNNNLFGIKNSRLINGNRAIPVIAAGSLNDETVITESFKNGAYDFISFPFRNHEVLGRIKNQIFLSKTRENLEKEVAKRTSDLTMANALLIESVQDYRKILKDLQENETLLLTIALNIPNSYLAIVEKDYTIGFAAGQEFKKSNFDPWRLIGLPIEKVFKEQSEFVKNNLTETFKGEEITFELEFNNQYQLYKAVPLFNSDGAVPRILVVAENITEQKTAERSIKESLKEKETLLKEIHHRVKNNMQLVCSMINLQAEIINNSEVFDLFKVLQSRIYSMSLVHEKLYRHKHFSKINFSEYVKELVSEIRNSFSGDIDKNRVRIELDLDEEDFTIDKAIPCGLILNELILNAFKHAALAPAEGFIRIIFKKIERECYKLSISDNGKGLPEGFNINQTESMGMMLVRELVNQIKGSIYVTGNSETTFTVIFGPNHRKDETCDSAEACNGKKNILLVEDERIISRMLRKIIEDCGYNIVDAVSSGREAINSACRYSPDLIIMDIMLEDEMDGVQAAAEILKKHQCHIVFLTGNSDPATLRSARDINPYRMLTKPVEKSLFIDTLQSALG